jgi:hypothetical protein
VTGEGIHSFSMSRGHLKMILNTEVVPQLAGDATIFSGQRLSKCNYVYSSRFVMV